MSKENILFGIIGLLAGLIIGFLATNYINNNEARFAPLSSASNAQIASQAQPQINQQVVRDQKQTGGMLPQVRETLDKAQKEPTNFEAQIAAGEMYSKIGNTQKAVEFYDRAAALNPSQTALQITLGNKFFDIKEFEKAEKWYTLALAQNPNDPNVRTDLGLTFFLRQPPDVDRAIAEYRKSLSINPNHELTLQNLAAAQKQKNDSIGLNETLAKLKSINPNNPILRQQ